MRRMILLAAAALCLTACGGETYAVPATEAYSTLSSVGTPVGVSPLPVGLTDVTMSFDSLPSDNLVRWRFSHSGADLGAITATVSPSGDSKSNVKIAFVDGSAPDDEGNNHQLRVTVQSAMMPLITEAVDSRFENRPFNMDLRRQVEVAALQANIGGIMRDVSSSMDKAVAEQKEREELRAARANNPYDATKPSVDLSKTN